MRSFGLLELVVRNEARRGYKTQAWKTGSQLMLLNDVGLGDQEPCHGHVLKLGALA
jgi:hypothetical protein